MARLSVKRIAGALGAEIAGADLRELDDETLAALCLGTGDCLLVESPYRSIDVDLEGIVRDLQARGFSIVLAHPERAPTLMRSPGALERLVALGAALEDPASPVDSDPPQPRPVVVVVVDEDSHLGPGPDVGQPPQRRARLRLGVDRRVDGAVVQREAERHQVGPAVTAHGGQAGDAGGGHPGAHGGVVHGRER
jgi:hypothetical protein